MNQPCACDHEVCEPTVLERPRYFPRQLISDAELTQEQLYFRDRLRRHNRLLHGWGVVCGALVCPYANPQTGVPEPWKVIVRSGYILGPYGDEIVIDCDRVFDLRTKCLTGVSGEPCTDAPDPWCSEVYVKPENPQQPVYVAVKYTESATRPVRVQPAGCGCDDAGCEYSRWRDGYEICVLPYCPERTPTGTQHGNANGPMTGGTGAPASGQPSPLTDDVLLLRTGCPPCPPEPWVVLAGVSTDANGIVTVIDNCDCRRLVGSLANFKGHCSGSVTIDKVLINNQPTDVHAILRVGEPGRLLVEGRGFSVDPKAGVSLGPDIDVSNIQVGLGGSLIADIRAKQQAHSGERFLVITNPDCGTAVKPIAIEIEPTEAPRSAPPVAAPLVVTRAGAKRQTRGRRR